MFLLVDHNDSFLYNLKAYIEELGHEVMVLPEREATLTTLATMNLQGIILSPGPGHPREATNSLKLIQHYKDSTPILGVCLGHQLLGYSLGATISHGPKPMHGKITPINHFQTGLFQKLISPMKVVRYHSLIVDKSTVNKDWHIDALDENGIIMGMHHLYYPLFSVQFHPEALFSQFGHQLLDNFCQFALSYERNQNHGI